jgi:hypothetical protein
MLRTPVYIVCSPRPDVGKTLISRLLTEFLLLQNGSALAFDINLREPSLVDYLPRLTETAAIGDTRAQMLLMDRLIIDDGIAKVIDLGLHAFDDFFKMVDEIGFMKEALRRGVEPVVMYIPDATRTSASGWAMLRRTFPGSSLIVIDNEHVLYGETPKDFAGVTPLKIAALPAFLKSIVSRTNFSFTHYLRTSQDHSAELYQWTRANFLKFRELEVKLKLH